jgi:hypothetical protein
MKKIKRFKIFPTGFMKTSKARKYKRHGIKFLIRQGTTHFQKTLAQRMKDLALSHLPLKI